MTKLISSIYGRGPSAYEAERRARLVRDQSTRAWRERGIAMIAVDELIDDWDRQMVCNIATKLYGRRRDVQE